MKKIIKESLAAFLFWKYPRDLLSNSANKLTITPVSGGPVYSKTINYDFKPSVGYLQFDAKFLNQTDYTIFILEKRKSGGSSNYFLGAESSNANNSLALA